MMKQIAITVLTAVVLTACRVDADRGRPNPSTELRARKPNIILIMVDDMGYSDIGCHGGEVKTPNIDMLAEKTRELTETWERWFKKCRKKGQ